MAKETGYTNNYTINNDFDDLDLRAKKQRAAYEKIWADIDLNYFPYRITRQKNGDVALESNRKGGDFVSYDSSLPESILNNSTAMAASYIIPSTEAGLQLEVENGSDDVNDTINIASKKIIDQLHQTGKRNSTLYQCLYPAVKSALCFGNGALMIEHEPDSTEPIISVLNIWDLYTISDEKTGQLHTVFRVTYDEDTGREKTEVWRDLSYGQKHRPLVINNLATYPTSYRVYLDKVPAAETKLLPVMPICLGRMFLDPGQMYGNGLGQRGLISVRKYNALHKRLMLVADNLICPAFGYIEGMLSNPDKGLDLTPGAANKITPNLAGQPFMPFLTVSPNAMAAIREAMMVVEAEIRAALMEKELMLPAETLDKMTATAANLWAAQANSLIAPALAGMTSSILHNMARIQLYRLLERGEISLDDVTLEKIQYYFLTKQDMMRKQVDSNIKNQNISKGIQMAQAMPSVMSMIKWDDYTAESFREGGVSEAYFRNQYEIEELEEKQAERAEIQSVQSQATNAAVMKDAPGGA